MKQAVGKVIGTVAGQSVLSLVHFFLSITFARLLTEAEFGKYVVGFSICAILYGAINAAVVTQVSVCFGAHTPERKTRAASTVIAVLAAVYLVAIAVFLVVSKRFDGPTGDYILAIACASFAYTLRETATYMLFLTNREYQAFLSQASIGVAFVGLVTFFLLGLEITSAVAALYVYALLSVPTVVIAGLVQIPLLRDGVLDASVVRQIGVAAVKSGKWALGSFSVEMLRNQAPNALGLMLGGFSAVAAINAARILISPPFLGMPLISRLLLHRFTAWRAQDEASKVMRVLKLMMAALLAGAAVYCVLISVFAERLIELLYGGKYSDGTHLVIFWCFFLLPAVVAEPMQIALFSEDKFRVVFLARAVIFVPLCIGALIFVEVLGPSYVPLLMGIGEAFTAVIFAVFTFALFRRR